MASLAKYSLTFARLALVAALACVFGGAAPLAAQDAKAIKKNLDAAQKALKAKAYDDALLSCKAALLVDPENAYALFLTSECQSGLSRPSQALESLLGALDAPKRGDNCSTWWKTAGARLAVLAPALSEFVKLRADIGGQLVSRATDAGKQKRANDQAWVAQMAWWVAPGEPGVDAYCKDRNLKPRANRPARDSSGFLDLLADPDAWLFYEKDGDTGIADGLLTMTPCSVDGQMNQAGLSRAALSADKFTLKFEAKYTVQGDADAILFVLFSDRETKDATKESCVFINFVVHKGLSPARRGKDGFWEIMLLEKFPEAPKVDTWYAFEIRWEAKGQRIAIDVGGKNLINTKLTYTLERFLTFGFSEGAKLTLRNIRLKNE